MIHFGILGAARIAPLALLAPARSNPSAEVVAVAASEPARARSYAAEHGISRTYTSYRELVESAEIDAVYIALPPAAHAEWSIAALDNGKHVLCEKPFAMNADQARRMADSATRTGYHLVEALHYRFHPFFHRALALLASGAIGRVKHVEGVFDANIADSEGQLRYLPHLGGGALMDLGCYPVHALRTIADGDFDVIAAECKLSPSGVDRSCRAELASDEGMRATIYCSMARSAPGPHETRLVVTGESGRMTLTNFVAPHDGNRIRIDNGEGSVEESVPGRRATYDYQLEHFVDVVDGRTLPLTGGPDAVETMGLIDAIYAAAGLDRAPAA